jgi:hypothetical protein
MEGKVECSPAFGLTEVCPDTILGLLEAVLLHQMALTTGDKKKM